MPSSIQALLAGVSLQVQQTVYTALAATRTALKSARSMAMHQINDCRRRRRRRLRSIIPPSQQCSVHVSGKHPCPPAHSSSAGYTAISWKTEMKTDDFIRLSSVHYQNAMRVVQITARRAETCTTACVWSEGLTGDKYD